MCLCLHLHEEMCVYMCNVSMCVCLKYQPSCILCDSNTILAAGFISVTVILGFDQGMLFVLHGEMCS